jgi:hypothetical protein
VAQKMYVLSVTFAIECIILAVPAYIIYKYLTTKSVDISITDELVEPHYESDDVISTINNSYGHESISDEAHQQLRSDTTSPITHADLLSFDLVNEPAETEHAAEAVQETEQEVAQVHVPTVTITQE